MTVETDDPMSDILTRMTKLRIQVNEHMGKGEWAEALKLTDEYEALYTKLTELAYKLAADAVEEMP